MRELLTVAWPLILSSGSVSLMHVVDRIFLTWHSRDALAAAMPAGLTFWTVLSLPMGLCMYVNTFVSQYEGAERPRRVARSVWQGVFLAVLGGVASLAFLPAAEPFFRAVGHAPPVCALESAYFSILTIGSLPMLLGAVLSCYFSGRGKTKAVMYVNIFTSMLNVTLDYLLIFGNGPFPKMGIHGAAWATVISLTAGAVCYVVLMLPGRIAPRYEFWSQCRVDGELLRRLLRYGLPNGVQFLIDVAGFTLFILIVGQTGTVQLAATNVTFNLNTFAFVPMLGVGTSILILVGRRIGEGRPDVAARTTWNGFRLTSLYMLGFAAIYVLLPRLILRPYSMFGDEGEFHAIEEQSVVLLRFIAVFSVFDGMAIVFGSAVRGAGDTRFSLAFSVCCSVGLMVVPSLAVWMYASGNLYLLWTSCTVMIIVLGLGFLLRFRSGQWKSMRVIESTRETRDSAPVAESEAALATGSTG